MCGAAQLKVLQTQWFSPVLSFAVKCSCGSGYLYWRVRVVLLTEFFLVSAGARASAGSPDDWSPSRQELLVQQDAGVSEEFSLLFLQLLVPSAALSKGRACLAEPPSPHLYPSRIRTSAVFLFQEVGKWDMILEQPPYQTGTCLLTCSAAQVSRHSAQVWWFELH